MENRKFQPGFTPVALPGLLLRPVTTHLVIYPSPTLMKKKRLLDNYRQNYLFTGIAGIVLSSTHSPFDSIDIRKNSHSVERRGTSGKSHMSKDRKNLIKIVHNPEKKSVRVVVKDIADQTIDFYVFDLEGTMVINYKLKSCI